MVKHITKTTYTAALNAVVDMIRCRKVSLDEHHIVIVPDKYTLYAEQKILQQTHGAFDVEVLTLDRLLFRLARVENALHSVGAVMLLRRALSDVRLETLARSSKFAGFAKRAFQTICTLKACKISPQNLLNTSDKKLRDIGAIYQAYEQKKAEQFLDFADRLELCATAIKQSSLIKNSNVYIANFNDISQKLESVFSALKATAKTCVITSVFGDLPSPKSLEVYGCPTDAHQLKAACRRILGAVRADKISFSDIGVIFCGDTELLLRVFNENNIPLNTDVKYNLGEHEAAIFLKLLFKLLKNKYNRALMLSLSQNSYARLGEEQASDFIYYVEKYAVNYGGFLQEFSRGDTAKAEQARERLVELIESFSAVVNQDSVAKFVGCLRDFLNAQGFEKITAELGCDSEIDFSQVCVKIHAALCHTELILGDSNDIELAVECFLEGLETEFSKLPNLADAVTAGQPQAFRGVDKKLFVIVGLNEGNLPKMVTDNGLINVFDAELIKKHAFVGVEPTAADLNRMAENELLQIICSGADIYITYSNAPSARQSYILKRFDAAEYTKTDDEFEQYVFDNGGESARLLAEYYCCSRSAAAELFAERAFADRIGLYNAVYSALGGVESGLDKYFEKPSAAKIEDCERLFFANSTFSASAAEIYYACPYMYFLQYGLRLSERAEGEVRPKDIGRVLHRIIELYVSCGGKVESLIDRAFSDCYQNAPLPDGRLRRRLSAEAQKLLVIVDKQLRESAYKVLFNEASIGKNGKFPPLELDNGITLTGYIDRVDATDDGFARVIDYKTGGADFDLSLVYYGRKLQLPLYLGAVCLNGGYKMGGAFYFPAKTRWSDDELSFRLVGVFNSDIDAMCMHDVNLRALHKSTVINAETVIDKNGNAICKAGNGGLSGAELKALCDYAKNLTARAAGLIRSGYFASAPLRYHSSIPCNYCRYKPLCASRCVRDTESGIKIENYDFGGGENG